MKLKKIFLCTIFSLINSVFFGNEFFKNFSFSITPSTGIMNGSVKEKLLYEINGENKLISLLDWNTQAASYFCADSEIQFNNFFTLGITGTYTLPYNLGIMQDYDWMNWYSSQTGEQTHYSWHKNKLNDFHEVEVFLGINFNLNSQLSFEQKLIYNYNFYSFSALDGYRQYNKSFDGVYPEWTCDIPKKDLYGNIIDYKGYTTSLGTGAKIAYAVSERIKLTFQQNLLYAVKSAALDNHNKRNISIYFDNKGKFSFTTNLSADYCLNKNNSIYAAGKYTYSVKNNSKIPDSNNIGGEICHILRFALGYTYTYEK